MAGHSRRTEASGPLDWSRQARAGILDTPTPLLTRPRTVASDLADRQLGALDRQALDIELEEQADAREDRARKRRIARLREEAEEARLAAIVEKASGGGGDAGLAAVLAEMNRTNQQNMDRMLDLLRTRDADKTSSDVGELRSHLTALGTRLEQAISSAGGKGTPEDATGPIRDAMAIVRSVQEFTQTLAPPAPSAPEGFTREQVLRQIAIEEEANLRRADAAERREDRAFAREEARRSADLSRARLEASKGMVEQYAGPVLAAILGDKAKDIMQNVGGQGGGAAAIAPGTPEQAQWQCPNCEAMNWSPVDADIVPCPGCGEMMRPFPPEHPEHPPGADQPHHHEGA